MKIKGTAVKTTPDYVKQNHPDQYSSWLDSLPPESKLIMEKPIMPTEWYPVKEAIITPTEKISELFYSGNIKETAFKLGRFSADVALKGVYKIFIRISTPTFMLSRATSIFTTYYSPADIKIVNSSNNTASIEFTGIEKNNILAAWRIAGWMEKALEIIKKQNIKVDVVPKFDEGNKAVVFELLWE